MFIKIIDEKTALELEGRGFAFTKETIGKNATLYAFEKSPELDAELAKNYSAIGTIEEDTLRFGGCLCQKV